jgi:NADPH:quinone reductase-like Zn-dependent oxidoreductase
MKNNVVPGSDGAGVVVEVGKSVTHFKAGDEVLTQFSQTHQNGPVTEEHAKNTLGGGLDGVLRQHGVLPDYGLVHNPKSLSLQEGSTLPCAALTAWNALYGLQSKAIIPGQWVLVEGTGGVSVFGLQFAKAAGCRVIATTSSDAKAEKLKQLGADHVLNYKQDKNWGETAKGLTPDKTGVDHIIEVGGPDSLTQAYKAIKPEGVITQVGFVGGTEGGPSAMSPLLSTSTIRGILVGSRAQFEQMNAAIDANGIKPVLDEQVYEFKDFRKSLEYMVSFCSALFQVDVAN